MRLGTTGQEFRVAEGARPMATKKGESGRAHGSVALCVLSVGLLLALAGCTLINAPPMARIHAQPLAGESPLDVTFDASGSRDPDGEIVSYRWDFGGGETASEETVHHVFVALTEIETYTVRLTVVDDQGESATASQSIEVHPGDTGNGDGGEGDGNAPVARFDASLRIGLMPLTVVFDARDSESGGSPITEYNWDFGDGEKGIGSAVSHTFDPEETETFTVTLFVWNQAGFVDTEQIEIIVIVPSDEPGDEDPVPEVTIQEIVEVYHSETPASAPSLYAITFDPRGSYADAGHQIEYYVWNFGDGTTRIESEPEEVTHIYELRSVTHTFVASLTVYDDYGLDGSVSINITLPTDAEET